MPTYDYDCSACGAKVDFFQSMSEAPKRKCPQCGAPHGLTRRIGCGGGLIFKGSGFYITDYRSEAYKSRAKSDAAPPASPDAGDKKDAGSADKKDAGSAGDKKDAGSAGAKEAKPTPEPVKT